MNRVGRTTWTPHALSSELREPSVDLAVQETYDGFRELIYLQRGKVTLVSSSGPQALR